MLARNETIFKWALYAGATAVFFLLQGAVLQRITLWGVIPFVFPILVAVLGMYEGPLPASVYALTVGVLCDLLLPASIPCFYTLIFPAAGLCAALISQSLLPAGRLRAELLLQNLLTGEKEICHLDSMAAGKEKTETKWSVCSNCCGAIRISVQKLLVSDMLGLFLTEQKLNISDTMIVLPEMKTVEVQVGDSFTTDWESIQYSEQKKGDDPGETFGIREYQPGDSTKMIHWKISQKLGELYVKEPGLPVENAVLLFFETAKLTGDSRTSDQAELMEKLISVSENLTEKGMHHKIGWYDQKKEQLCMEEIDSADNLAQIIHGLLSLERKEKTFTGLQEYAQKYQEQPFGHILYFTAEDPGNLADLFAWQCSFQTVRPGEDVGILLI